VLIAVADSYGPRVAVPLGSIVTGMVRGEASAGVHIPVCIPSVGMAAEDGTGVYRIVHCILRSGHSSVEALLLPPWLEVARGTLPSTSTMEAALIMFLLVNHMILAPLQKATRDTAGSTRRSKKIKQNKAK
jgi:hypothetical protein